MEEARRHGTRVSYDLNYRDSLWRAVGGQARAREVNRALMPFVDVLFGNEEDFVAALGIEIPGVDAQYAALPTAGFRTAIDAVMKAYPNLTAVAVTLRTAHSASSNGWGALCRYRDTFFEVPQRDVAILDRVGGGDSFASGFIYGLLAGKDPAVGARLRGGARRAGHVDPRRHDDGLSPRGAARHGGPERTDRSMTPPNSRRTSITRRAPRSSGESRRRGSSR